MKARINSSCVAITGEIGIKSKVDALLPARGSQAAFLLGQQEMSACQRPLTT
jgi:hypothetical protein